MTDPTPTPTLAPADLFAWRTRLAALPPPEKGEGLRPDDMTDKEIGREARLRTMAETLYMAVTLYGGSAFRLDLYDWTINPETSTDNTERLLPRLWVIHAISLRRHKDAGHPWPAWLPPIPED